jgi:predicted transposase YbfD/YdcC
VLPAPARINFPHARQVIRVTRGRTKQTTGERTGEIAYYITSLPPGQPAPEQLNTWIRGHWGIENKLRWVRDVTFKEDHSQIRTRNAPHVMASLRNLTISILRLTGATNIAKALRKTARNPQIAYNLTGL